MKLVFFRYLQLLLIGVLAFLVLAGVGGAQEVSEATGELPRVTGVRVSSTAERARLVIDLTGVTSYAFVSFIDPMRIGVDVRAAGMSGELSGTAAGEGLIGDYSVEQIGPDRVRTYLNLSVAAKVQQAYVLDPIEDQPARLIIDVVRSTPEAFADQAEADLQASIAQNEAAQAGNNNTQSNAGEELPDGADTQGAGNTAVSRPLILIDPGHGGVDGGATTANDVREKTITLLFAKQLQGALIDTGKFDVALTREDDVFFRLEERVDLARQNKADLLISIHADSFEDKSIRGASVYIRDEEATDVMDKVLAENENRADLLAGYLPPQNDDVVVDLLVDLMRREMRRQSFLVAQAVVVELKTAVRVRRFPLRRADFFVLQSPDVPAILLELGFLSNETDAQNLTSQTWRKRAVDAVSLGISSYFYGAGAN